MTTFQDPPPHSRRALRNSERTEGDSSATPTAAPTGRRAQLASSTEWREEVVPADGETSGVPAESTSDESTTADDAAVVDSTTASPADEVAPEPSTYVTLNRPQIPTYATPAFRDIVAPATGETAVEAPSADSQADAPSAASRPRDFSPQGRRATLAAGGDVEASLTSSIPSSKKAQEETDTVAPVSSIPDFAPASTPVEPVVVVDAPPAYVDDQSPATGFTMTRRELRELRNAAEKAAAERDGTSTIDIVSTDEREAAARAEYEALTREQSIIAPPVAPVEPVAESSAPVDGAASVDAIIAEATSAVEAEEIAAEAAPAKESSGWGWGRRKSRADRAAAAEAAQEAAAADVADAADDTDDDEAQQVAEAEQPEPHPIPVASEPAKPEPVVFVEAVPETPVDSAIDADDTTSGVDDDDDDAEIVIEAGPDTAPRSAVSVVENEELPALIEAEPAADSAAPVQPVFIEPQAAPASAREPGHWSVDIDKDDEAEALEALESTFTRTVGSSSGTVTTSALVLPSIPQSSDMTMPYLATGEIMITGSIDLPRSLGSTGVHPDRLDNSDFELDPLDREAPSTNSAPVRAIRAVSTHTSSQGIISNRKPQGNRMLTVMVISASSMAVGVVGLLIAGFALKIF
ncbi:hypothetical protein [Glaciihabitans sp. dw_435]|uniref:hypothetical protein n=1 Tax=Glaciihabitans sp. dw_435 TaxID=2720081 RepID=UPI001BD1EE32|nr:hypothetical protein [Glaciihabitans sp. dw_435]